MFEYRMRRAHKRTTRDLSRVMKLSNGQFIITIPREMTRLKKIEKATLLKWSDGGQNRIIIEIVNY